MRHIAKVEDFDANPTIEDLKSPGCFIGNEQRRLMGMWFTPLPFHYWGLIPGMAIEVEYISAGKSFTVKGSYRGFDGDGFSGVAKVIGISIMQEGKSTTSHIPADIIKKMRIVSFEVENDA